MDIHMSARTVFTGQTLTTTGVYQLVAYPDADFTNWARTLGFTDKPVIELAQFHTTEHMEATLLKWMHRIISQQKSFRVVIDGFGALPSRRIFMRIANQQPFTQLAASLQVLDQYLKSYGCMPSKLIQQPLLALTSPLPPDAFEQLAAQYVNKVAQPFFELSTVTLIRKEHALDKGKQVSVFGLQTL
jgi:hypothetical protein